MRRTLWVGRNVSVTTHKFLEISKMKREINFIFSDKKSVEPTMEILFLCALHQKKKIYGSSKLL